ncbi:TIR domain-containing protein [Nocardia spumae]|uniref:TIR domain-containing protein n=1 Tax=Nocardia spumae TaxID=2887190 RepID=UPI001D14B1CD|nr:TIR domain-containing protein [Nocardia spumae]
MAVFISYHSSKRAVVEHIARYFLRHGIATWWAPRDVPPGSKWDEAISEAINEASALVLLFCASADTSIHVKREVALADRAKLPIYWVRLEDVQPHGLGYFLSPTQWVDWLDRRDETLDSLVGDLQNPAVDGRALGPETQQPNRPPRVSGWPAGVVAFDNEMLAAEAAAHTYFRIANEAPHRSVVLPTGRAATQLFGAMLRIADQYAPKPFGSAPILSDTETFGVFTRHHSSRTRHVLEALIEPLTERGLGPDPRQLHLLSGQISENLDPVQAAQRIIRLHPPAVHGISISPEGEVLGYEIGTYKDPDDIAEDGCRIVELSEHGRRYIDPNQPSRSVITVGLSSAIECAGLMVLGFDRSKARIIHQMTHFPEAAGVPATMLRRNAGTVIVTTRRIAEDADLEDVHYPTSAKAGSEWIAGKFS